MMDWRESICGNVEGKCTHEVGIYLRKQLITKPEFYTTLEREISKVRDRNGANTNIIMLVGDINAQMGRIIGQRNTMHGERCAQSGPLVTSKLMTMEWN